LCTVDRLQLLRRLAGLCVAVYSGGVELGHFNMATTPASHLNLVPQFIT
jgi:hypothetical protein